MAMDISGQVAVITGASRGIGKACAFALAKEGVNVVVTSRTEEELNALAAEIESDYGVKALAVKADVADEKDVARLAETTFGAFGQVDILVNNAGVARYAPLVETTVEDYDWMMITNVRSTYLCTHAFLPGMLSRGAGSVITVSSQAGLHGFANEAVYCATKFAQVGFMQALDHEVREKGVKVSIIAPGGVDTHFAFGTGREEGAPYLDDMLEAESVADAVVFAAKQSPKSRIPLIGMRPMSEPLF
ncbi:MAG: SDR family oxidoreductase [Aggregatilineales bacterium]